jgi:phage-related protein
MATDNGFGEAQEAVGSYTDASGLVHGFIRSIVNNIKTFVGPVDDPHGLGASLINGINDNHVIVGFYGACATGGTTCNGLVSTP